MDDVERGMSAVAQRLSEALAENEKFRAAFRDLLSVRDQFAKAAMQGCIASGRFHGYAACAADSYAMADAMMVARGTSGMGEAPAPSRDAERLEWIARQGDEFSSGIVQDRPGDGDHYVNGMNDAYGIGKTFREAIDNARGVPPSFNDQPKGGA